MKFHRRIKYAGLDVYLEFGVFFSRKLEGNMVHKVNGEIHIDSKSKNNTTPIEILIDPSQGLTISPSTIIEEDIEIPEKKNLEIFWTKKDEDINLSINTETFVMPCFQKLRLADNLVHRKSKRKYLGKIHDSYSCENILESLYNFIIQISQWVKFKNLIEIMDIISEIDEPFKNFIDENPQIFFHLQQENYIINEPESLRKKLEMYNKAENLAKIKEKDLINDRFSKLMNENKIGHSLVIKRKYGDMIDIDKGELIKKKFSNLIDNGYIKRSKNLIKSCDEISSSIKSPTGVEEDIFTLKTLIYIRKQEKEECKEFVRKVTSENDIDYTKKKEKLKNTKDDFSSKRKEGWKELIPHSIEKNWDEFLFVFGNFIYWKAMDMIRGRDERNEFVSHLCDHSSVIFEKLEVKPFLNVARYNGHMAKGFMYLNSNHNFARKKFVDAIKTGENDYHRTKALYFKEKINFKIEIEKEKFIDAIKAIEKSIEHFKGFEAKDEVKKSYINRLRGWKWDTKAEKNIREQRFDEAKTQIVKAIKYFSKGKDDKAKEIAIEKKHRIEAVAAENKGDFNGAAEEYEKIGNKYSKIKSKLCRAKSRALNMELEKVKEEIQSIQEIVDTPEYEVNRFALLVEALEDYEKRNITNIQYIYNKISEMDNEEDVEDDRLLNYFGNYSSSLTMLLSAQRLKKRGLDEDLSDFIVKISLEEALKPQDMSKLLEELDLRETNIKQKWKHYLPTFILNELEKIETTEATVGFYRSPLMELYSLLEKFLELMIDFEDENYPKNHLFSLNKREYEVYLDEGPITPELRAKFEEKGYKIDEDAEIFEEDEKRFISQNEGEDFLIEIDEGMLNIYAKKNKKYAMGDLCRMLSKKMEDEPDLIDFLKEDMIRDKSLVELRNGLAHGRISNITKEEYKKCKNRFISLFKERVKSKKMPVILEVIEENTIHEKPVYLIELKWSDIKKRFWLRCNSKLEKGDYYYLSLNKIKDYEDYMLNIKEQNINKVRGKRIIHCLESKK